MKSRRQNLALAIRCKAQNTTGVQVTGMLARVFTGTREASVDAWFKSALCGQDTAASVIKP